jgi:hypothetical protein
MLVAEPPLINRLGTWIAEILGFDGTTTLPFDAIHQRHELLGAY